MLTHAADIAHVHAALQMYLTARDKLCQIIHANSASSADTTSVQQVIDQVGAASQHLSTLLPPEPQP